MRSRLHGEYREVEEGPAPFGDGRERQLGRWREDIDGPTLTFLWRTRPPSHHQAPALAAPTLSRRSGLRSSPPPLTRSHPQFPESPPLNHQAGALAFTRANRHLASPAPAPIRAGWRRGFSNVIEAPPGAPRSLLFGESQAGIELASLPGGSIPLRPELGVGLGPLPARLLQLSILCVVSGQDRASASCFNLPGLGSLGMAGVLMDWATLTFEVRFGVCFRIC